MIDTEAGWILDVCIPILREKRGFRPGRPHGIGMSERCVETPWVASHVPAGSRLLDIGFTMASLDYLGLLLALRRDHGVEVEAIDIVKPYRVKRRYPGDWLDEVLSVPITIGDIRTVRIPESRYDVVTCISTIEHIGFDVATSDNPNTAFERALAPDRVPMTRDPDTNRVVLDRFFSALKPGGAVLISVPMGRGGPTLLKDSLGYYCAQWEYDGASWNEIVSHPGFAAECQRFFGHDPDRGWQEVPGPDHLTRASSSMKPHAEGCALAALRKR